MAISQKDLKILLQRSGNRCAFPSCGKILVHDETDVDNPVLLSEIAHIVAQKTDGPRGQHALPLEKRDNYGNLILLCEEHHHIIDSQPQTFTVERLRQMKADHEQLMAKATERAILVDGDSVSRDYVHETLHSTLLPVLKMPRYIYAAPCGYNDSQEREAVKAIVYPTDKTEMYPFIIRGGNLICFNNLRYKGGPFRGLVDSKKVECYETRTWWDDPDRMRWFVSLLNRSLNKLTGHKGLHLDKRHRRYFFMSENPGEPLAVSYRPLNQSVVSRHVVWQPVTKKTGLPKHYWLHRAVALKFHRVSRQHWCLSIRPEMHVTEDGAIPLDSQIIGSKVTRHKSRMFNFDLLGELQFWRDFLCESQPRIVLSFGKRQHTIISTTLMQTDVEWPGTPEEYRKSFKNVEYLDDLFSWAAFRQLEAEYDTAEDDGEDSEGWEEYAELDEEP